MTKSFYQNVMIQLKESQPLHNTFSIVHHDEVLKAVQHSFSQNVPETGSVWKIAKIISLI